MANKILNILLVEDDPVDVDLTMELLDDASIRLNIQVVNDGAKALAYLFKEEPYHAVVRPDLILLDLNLPKKNGTEVLDVIKHHQGLKQIPVVILTTSDANEDIAKSYNLGANSYVTKADGLEQFGKIIKSLECFWLHIAKLP